jgi:hypothetical protein
MFDFNTIAPIVLLMLSELLPFLQSTQANGIVQFIILLLKSYTQSQVPSTTTNIFTAPTGVPPVTIVENTCQDPK